MAVAVTQANVPHHLAGLSSGAATGVASLIHMQFRKEHRTLYELYQELKKQVGALHQSEAVDRLDELVRRLDEAETRVLRIEELSKQLEVTDSKLKILEDRMTEIGRTNEKYRTEVVDLKNKMGRLEKQLDDSMCCALDAE
jgi:DNA repair ATPase RecN